MNTLIKHFRLGLSTYFQSFSFIVKHRMIHYYFYPVIIIVLLAIGATAGIRELVDLIQEWVKGYLTYDSPQGDGWWENLKLFFSDISKYLVSAILWIIFMYVYYKLSKYIVLILMSPIMALVSEKTEEQLTGREYPFILSQFIKDIWRGVLISFRNMFLELFFIIIIWLADLLLTLLFPPLTIVLTPLSFVLSFAVGAYYYGFATMDYTNERRKLDLTTSVQFIKKYRGVAIANGTIFSIWVIIPILGTYIGTIFAPITCTVGATLAINKIVDLGKDGLILKSTPEEVHPTNE